MHTVQKTSRTVTRFAGHPDEIEALVEQAKHPQPPGRFIGAAPLLLAACEAADLALADILMDAEEFIELPTLVAALDALSVALDTSRVPTAKARARWGEFAAASGLST